MFNPLLTRVADHPVPMTGTSQNPMVRAMTVAALGATALALSGCAYGMGEFAQSRQNRVPVAETTQTGIPVKPATYVVDSTTPPAAIPTSASVPPPATSAAGFPNMNQVPPPPKGKLLTPAEKAKVIADLEALARGQEAAVDKLGKTPSAKCDDAVLKSLDPEAKLKSEVAGQGC